MIRALILSFVLLSSVAPQIAFSHGGEDHDSARKQESKYDEDGFEIVSEGPSKAQLEQINQSYLKSVKPIFQKKCFDCHGGTTHFPWYYAIPGVKGMIDDDITEAKKHMDMSEDFPFQGHGAPIDDLKAISKTINEGTMPPFRYWMIHWNSRLTEGEKKAVLEWSKRAQEILTDTAPSSSSHH
ncbi:MAG: hypothetical protein CL678_14230 [Bdellovibrionaceae bacterium]|nr:hypothetical protein [Pseudobdellovibrionaceae bacterium]